MEFKSLENPFVKKIRVLTVYLVTSVSVNIFLITAVTYFTWSKHHEEKLSEHPPHYEVSTSNAKALNHYFLLSYEDLLKELGDKTLLQDGYTKRDLALACLINYHFFDVEKAVSGTSLQRRKMTFVHKEGGEVFNLEVFPGLTDRDYQMIVSFIQRHKYPLTAEGLFQELRKKKGDAQLAEAFFGTTEFYALFYSLNHGEVRVSQEKLLNMLLEGSWPAVVVFTQQQRHTPERARDNLRDFLKKYIKAGSSEAASIWISFEGEYLLRQLDDEHLALLISLCKENSMVTQLFLKKVLCSVRSDLVRKSAGLKLYSFEGVMPNPYNQTEAMKKFLPTLFNEKAEVVPEPVKVVEKKHTVQAGDSLWKIAKKYGITIEELRKTNDLEHDQLKPGQTLKVGQHHPNAKDGT